MTAETIRAAEDAYFILRGQFDAGRITREQFDEKLRQLAVQDALGRYWMLGAESGKWYFYDGSNWVQGDPLSATAPVAGAPTRAAADPSRASRPGFEPAYSVPPLAPASASERRFPLVPLLVGGALVLFAITAFFVFQNRGPVFVAQQPAALITPLLPATRTSIFPTETSEPDFFNTDTPVPTLSIPTPGIPSREPTAPIVIFIPTQQAPSNIPTITPFVLDTAVPQPPSPPVSNPVSTPVFPPPPPVPPTGRLRVANGPDAQARYMPASQFILDGSLDEWNGNAVPLTVPHFGADNWLGPADLSGTAWLAWNENFLLVAVDVVDDAHVQTQRNWEMFRGDSVELWIDADLEGDFDVVGGNEDDYQFGFSPGDFGILSPEGVLYIPYRDATLNQQIFVAAQRSSEGYTLEAAIPWAVLRVQPGQGRVLGYSVDLSDNDVPFTARQQTQVNHNPNFQFQMPATFGNLFLD